MKNGLPFSLVRALIENTIHLPVHQVEHRDAALADFVLQTYHGVIDAFREEEHHETLAFFRTMKEQVVYTMTDRFLCYYVILTFPTDKQYLILGPCLTQEVTPLFLQQVIGQNHLTQSMKIPLMNFYHTIPLVSSSTINTLGRVLLQHLYGENNVYSFQNFDEVRVEPELTNAWTANSGDLLLMRVMEHRYEMEGSMMLAVANGQRREAFEWYNRLTPEIDRISRERDPVRNSKNLLITQNCLLRKAAQSGGVHPVYLDEISNRFAKEIETSATRSALQNLGARMLREYCILVQNYALGKYSPLVRDTINYVNLNLSAPLSVQKIADVLSVSANYLSGLFKREVSVPLIEYINKQRIKSAVLLLDSTMMPIHRIASYVGYDDINYFSRVFKRFVGKTPTEYRKIAQPQ